MAFDISMVLRRYNHFSGILLVLVYARLALGGRFGIPQLGLPQIIATPPPVPTGLRLSSEGRDPLTTSKVISYQARRRALGALLDHLIRPQQQRLRDGKSQGRRRLDVDYQVELRRLLNGQVTGLGPLEDLVHERRGAALHGVLRQVDWRTRSVPRAVGRQDARQRGRVAPRDDHL